MLTRIKEGLDNVGVTADRRPMQWGPDLIISFCHIRTSAEQLVLSAAGSTL